MADLKVMAYAMQILAEHGCDEYTYGDENSRHVLDDLKEAYPNGMEYPYIDVANAILSISRPKPIEKKRYLVLWDTPDCCDGVGTNDLEKAKDLALGIMSDWVVYEQMEWHTPPKDYQIDNFNQMIWDCGAWVQKYHEDTDTYEDYWFPSAEDLKEIGWEEIKGEQI